MSQLTLSKETTATANVQRKAAGPARAGRAPSVVHEVLASAGRPMDMASRGFFEPRFSHDFGSVRIHSDARAQSSAAAVNARAYTVGHDVVLGKGVDASGAGGRRLLAHELAHVVQQEKAASAKDDLAVSQDAAAENQADATAERVEGQDTFASGGVSSPALSPAQGMSLQRQPDGSGPDSGLKKLEKSVEDAANLAGQKIKGGGKDKLGGHIPTAPELRHVPDPKKPEPTKPVPKENLRPDPHEKTPVAPTPDKPPDAAAPEKPDPGKREGQFAEGAVYQSGPNQTGMAVQGAFQDKNYVPGEVYDFIGGFKVQLGVLQPTYTLQYSHLQPTKAVAGSAAQPLPPTDSVQASATISPVVITKGNLTIAPQIGVATSVGWDGSGGPRQPGSSGTHGQALGVINLQVDYKFDDSFSVTATAGDQAGLDESHEGPKGTNAITGSVVATLHF